MGGWAGFRPPEFGTYPVELEFSLDSYVGPAWVVPALFNRSGWLSVAEVDMETEFDRTTAVVAACVNDEGEVQGQWVTEALFSMRCSLPREALTEPPDDLELALDALYWDFLGRCDLQHLRQLEEREANARSTIARLELRRREVYEKVETVLSGLYARRRREHDNPDLRRVIDAKIAEIEEKQGETEHWHQQQLTRVSNELDEFERQAFAALRNHGRMAPLYTLRWGTAHTKVKRAAAHAFELRFSRPAATPAAAPTRRSRRAVVGSSEVIPVHESSWSEICNHEMDAKTARAEEIRQSIVVWKTEEALRQREIAASKIPIRITKKRDAASPDEQETEIPYIHQAPTRPRSPTKTTSTPNRPARSKTKAEKMEQHRATMELLYRDWERNDPEKFEREKKLREQITEFNRRRAEEKGLFAELAPPPVAEFARRSTLEHELFEALGGNRKQQSTTDQKPCSSSTPVPMAELDGALTSASASPLAANPIAPKPAIVIATASEQSDSLQASVVPIKGKQPPPLTELVIGAVERPFHIVVGDRVLLRFEDGSRARLQYLILDEDNDPAKGVISTQDSRAQAILGRNVGDRVCLEIAGRERFAVIEKILNFDQNASE